MPVLACTNETGLPKQPCNEAINADQPRWRSSTGIAASAAGIAVSFKYDLPTGPVIVCAFGLMLLLAFGVRRVLPARA